MLSQPFQLEYVDFSAGNCFINKMQTGRFGHQTDDTNEEISQTNKIKINFRNRFSAACAT